MQKTQTIGMTLIILGRPECFCEQIGQLCRIWSDHMEKFLDDWDDQSNWRLSQKSSLLFLHGWGNRDECYGNQALTVAEDTPWIEEKLL